MTYQEFKVKYQSLLEAFLADPQEIVMTANGPMIKPDDLSEQLADMDEAYPEFEERFFDERELAA